MRDSFPIIMNKALICLFFLFDYQSANTRQWARRNNVFIIGLGLANIIITLEQRMSFLSAFQV